MPARRSLWWRWTPPADGLVHVDTLAADFDTTLAVYRGDRLDTLVEQASDDDVAAGVERQSALEFFAVAGFEYRIAVDGFDGASGSLALALAAPAPPPARAFAGGFEGPE